MRLRTILLIPFVACKVAQNRPPKITGLFREFGIDNIALAMYTKGMNEGRRKLNQEIIMTKNTQHTQGPDDGYTEADYFAECGFTESDIIGWRERHQDDNMPESQEERDLRIHGDVPDHPETDPRLSREGC